MEFKLDVDTVLDVLGTASAAYVAYVLVGGSPIPGFAQLVPWFAAAAAGVFVWRQVRKNNNAKK